MNNNLQRVFREELARQAKQGIQWSEARARSSRVKTNPHPHRDEELFESIYKLSNSENVTLISYDGLVTGSCELREDNKNSYYRLFKIHKRERLIDTFSENYLNDEEVVGGAVSGEREERLTLLGQYSVEYDKSDHPITKFAEPHYDGFLVGIALLNDETFNKNFEYVETEIKDKYLPYNTEFQPSHLVTDIIPESRFDRKKLNYASAVHIFVLGPLTRSCLRDIVKQIQDAEGNIIIHVQGEANGSGPTQDKKTTAYTAPMMTPKAGMFPTAFNLYTGEREMHALRKMVSHSYTVAVKVNEAEAEQRHEEGKIRYPFKGKPLNHIPSIYDDILGFIERNILTTSQGRDLKQHQLFSKLKKINTALICQDFFDKDNGPALAFLLMFSSSTPHINLINRRIYDLEYEECTAKWAVIPPNKAYLDGVAQLIRDQNRLKETPPIGFAISKNGEEWHSPIYVKDADKSKSIPESLSDVVLNGVFQQEITKRVRDAMRVRMPILIDEVLQIHKIQIKPSYADSTKESTTDGEDEISWTRRAPFSEPLYVPRSHFWSLYYPRGLPEGKKYDDPVEPTDAQIPQNRKKLALGNVSNITVTTGGRYSRRKMPKNKYTKRRKNKNVQTKNKKLKRKTR